jgi:hypothetical protein
VKETKEKDARNTPGGEALMKRLGGEGALPFFAFLDATGAPIVNSVMPPHDGKKGGDIGHPIEPSEVDWFLVMVDKAAPRMTADERGTIEKWLRAQKR